MQEIILELSDAFTISEPPYKSFVVDEREELLASCRRLRYDYFVHKRGWIEPRPAMHGEEGDHYDSECRHFAVFEGDKLRGYLRALSWQPRLGFMLEHDFLPAISTDTFKSLQREHSLEISRLVITPDLLPDEVLRVTELLFKVLYFFCQTQNVAHLYAVLEAGWLRLFQQRFQLPFQAIGPIHRFPDGTKTVAAYASLRQFEQYMLATDPLKLLWYQSK